MTDDNVTRLPARPGRSQPSASSDLVRPPVLSRMRALEVDIDTAVQLSKSIRESLTQWNDAAALRKALAAIDLVGLRKRKEGSKRPADERERAVLVAYLFAATLIGNRDEQYPNVFVEEVAEVCPSLGALSRAVRRLVRREEWLPSIAKTLDAIEEAELHLKCKDRELDDLSEWLEMARKRLKHLERTPEEIERDELLAREKQSLAREKQIVSTIASIEEGQGYSHIRKYTPREIFEEARRRIVERGGVDPFEAREMEMKIKHCIALMDQNRISEVTHSDEVRDEALRRIAERDGVEHQGGDHE